MENAGPGNPLTRLLFVFCAILAAALVLITYRISLDAPFHIDDRGAVVENPFIRSLGNLPLFFTDANTSSTNPPERTWRPVVSVSFALDYWLGKGLTPAAFRISTFLLFLAQLAVMFLLFRSTGLSNWVALFGVSLYGVHPAISATINAVTQRGEVFCGLALAAGLSLYVRFPGLRVTGLYLFPVAIGIFSGAEAIVFPLLLFLWLLLFTPAPRDDADHFWIALVQSLPAAVVSGVGAGVITHMSPATPKGRLSPGVTNLLAEPAALLDRFRLFFVPIENSAGREPDIFNLKTIAGFLFVATLIAVAWRCRKRPETRPIAFGLAWFLIVALPAVLIPYGQIEGDQRLYLPAIGLALAACQAGALLAKGRRMNVATVAAGCLLMLAGFARAAHMRNLAWSAEESLWRDRTVRSPENSRGLLHYGQAALERGHGDQALAALRRALVLSPDSPSVEWNMGNAWAMVNNPLEAERHFLRAIQMAPSDAAARFAYGRWLLDRGRRQEAIGQLDLAVRWNPDSLEARHVLLQLYYDEHELTDFHRTMQSTLLRFPEDSVALDWLRRRPAPLPAAPPPVIKTAPPPVITAKALTVKTPPPLPPAFADALLAQSLVMFRAAQYLESIAAAREALKFRPNDADAWNVISAAYTSMSQWDQGIAAATEAIRLRPDFQLAKNNLAWALEQKQKAPK